MVWQTNEPLPEAGEVWIADIDGGSPLSKGYTVESLAPDYEGFREPKDAPRPSSEEESLIFHSLLRGRPVDRLWIEGSRVLDPARFRRGAPDLFWIAAHVMVKGAVLDVLRDPAFDLGRTWLEPYPMFGPDGETPLDIEVCALRLEEQKDVVLRDRCEWLSEVPASNEIDDVVWFRDTSDHDDVTVSHRARDGVDLWADARVKGLFLSGRLARALAELPVGQKLWLSRCTIAEDA